MAESKIATYIGYSEAESRVKKARAAVREGMLQTVELEGGHIVEDADGVAAIRVPCPACSQDKPDALFDALEQRIIGSEGATFALLEALRRATNSIEVEAPYGLQAGEMAGSHVVHRDKLDADVLAWALARGVLKLEVDTAALTALDADTSPEVREFAPRLNKAITRPSYQTLRRMSKTAIRKALA